MYWHLHERRSFPCFYLQKGSCIPNHFSLLRFAIPVMPSVCVEQIRVKSFILIIVYLSSTELIPSNKIDNVNLCALAQQEWEKPNGLTTLAQSCL